MVEIIEKPPKILHTLIRKFSSEIGNWPYNQYIKGICAENSGYRVPNTAIL